jgi:hypothetical protein
MEVEKNHLQDFADALQIKDTETVEVSDDQEQEYDPLQNEGPEDDDEEQLQEEVDEGEDDESEEPAEEESSAEGPSDAMLAVARLQGVPEALLSIARSDDDVSKLLEFAKQPAAKEEEQPQQEQPPEEGDLDVSDFFGEEDLDDTDPAHKALKKVVEVLNEERKTSRLLLQHASHQMQMQQQQESRQFQQPFDDALDSMESPVFGSTAKGLSDSQIKARKQAFSGYLSLAEGEPAERRKELAEAAVRAKFANVFQGKPDVSKKKALAKQSRKRLGGSKAKSKPSELSPQEEFEKRLLALGSGT